MKKTMNYMIKDGVAIFCDKKELHNATIGDFVNAGFSSEDIGLKYEGENEYGKELFSGIDFEGSKTLEEISEVKTSWFCISYHDGSNMKYDIYEPCDVDEAYVDIESLEDPSPAYYFNYILHVVFSDGSKKDVRCTKSNMSGLLSPYYEEDNESL